MSKVDEAKAALSAKSEPAPKIIDGLLSTGVTLIDLSIAGRIGGSLIPGKMYHIAGRQGAGKTFLTRKVMAEAARSTYYDKYELIYDDVEYGALMDTAKFFGNKLVKRLVPPAWSKKKNPMYSRTMEEFYARINKRLSAGKPIIWIEDSLDALDTNASKMTDHKAKMNSQELRKLLQPLNDTKSILILISQARADLKSIFGGDLVSGGRALEHYPSVSIWLKKVGAIPRSYKGNKYVVGQRIAASVKKNRVSGQSFTVYFPFYPDYGIDDIGANIDFLTRNHWEREKQEDGVIITSPEFDYEGSPTGLIKKIEENNLQRELKVLTGKVFKEIQKAISVERKRPYE